MDFSASRPTRFMSSPCPAIPTTSVPKINGTMIDLMMRMNALEIGSSDRANAGKNTPSATPTNMATTIHCVRLRRRRKVHIGGLTITARKRNSLALDERPAPELVVGVRQLFLGVHHDRPLPGDRLLERLSRDQQEPHPLLARVHRDLVAGVEQDEGAVPRFLRALAARIASTGRDAIGANALRCGRIAEAAAAFKDVCERMPRRLDRNRLAPTRRNPDVKITGIGGDAFNGSALAPEPARDDPHPGTIVVHDLGDLLRVNILIAGSCHF